MGEAMKSGADKSDKQDGEKFESPLIQKLVGKTVSPDKRDTPTVLLDGLEDIDREKSDFEAELKGEYDIVERVAEIMGVEAPKADPDWDIVPRLKDVMGLDESASDWDVVDRLKEVLGVEENPNNWDIVDRLKDVMGLEEKPE